MTVRQLVLAWALALAIAVGAAAGLITLVARTRPELARGEIAVIGSSPTLAAIPNRVAGGLLADGRPHRRLAHFYRTEAETVDLIEQAIDTRAPVVLVEANPLVFDFAFAIRQRPCDGWKMALRAYAADQRDKLRAAFSLSQRPAVYTADIDPARMIGPQGFGLRRDREPYPLHARAPCELKRLVALAARARSQHTRMILVLPPRSPLAVARLGPVEGAIRAKTRQLAAQMGVELFVPQGTWTNAEFVDLSHVNLAGRRHFLIALRRWWVGLQ